MPSERDASLKQPSVAKCEFKDGVFVCANDWNGRRNLPYRGIECKKMESGGRGHPIQDFVETTHQANFGVFGVSALVPPPSPGFAKATPGTSPAARLRLRLRRGKRGQKPLFAIRYSPFAIRPNHNIWHVDAFGELK